MFRQFSFDHISQSDFELDEIGNRKYKNQNLKLVVQCLFEGLTRKIPAMNYLRYVN